MSVLIAGIDATIAQGFPQAMASSPLQFSLPDESIPL
jgi:hypothetical protein